MRSPSAALELPLNSPEACLLPLVPQHQAMVSLTTATTDQSSLTNTIGDQWSQWSMIPWLDAVVQVVAGMPLVDSMVVPEPLMMMS